MTKYHAKPTEGYASKREARRASELKLLERAGKISELHEQVRFELIKKQNGEPARYYVADFTYMENGQLVVEDCKGYRTQVYQLKRAMMLDRHGIKVRET